MNLERINFDFSAFTEEQLVLTGESLEVEIYNNTQLAQVVVDGDARVRIERNAHDLLRLNAALKREAIWRLRGMSAHRDGEILNNC